MTRISSASPDRRSLLKAMGVGIAGILDAALLSACTAHVEPRGGPGERGRPVSLFPALDRDAGSAPAGNGEPAVNITDFPWRADPTGAADSTGGVQAFFDYLAASGGAGTGTGTFLITNSIVIDPPEKAFTFRGTGAGTKFLADFSAKTLRSVFYVRSAFDTLFEGFVIDSRDSSNVAHGMSISNSTNTTTKNIQVTGWGMTAIMFYFNGSFPGRSAHNRIISCTAKSRDHKARNGFMLENSTSSQILDCHVSNLDPLGDPSYGLQLKNGCVNCSIIGGSVDGARAGVAFGNTKNLVAAGLIVSGVTVRNCLVGAIVAMCDGARVDMTVDMINAPFCEFGLYIAGDTSNHGRYNMTVLNIPDTGLAVMMRNTGNTVNLTMNRIGAAELVLFNAGSTRNTVNVVAVGGEADPAILKSKITDNSGRGSGNKVTFPSSSASLDPRGNAA